ncbi:cytochrome c family protein [Solidesulfovibrio carbinoliphilus subsp. oakridgensis]|uniref:Cytochrome c family protein n=1 Tax=Solidesulfovibrio carbinoliphilus subsp. oakridgensis TaxID=694327 RepID=G7Q9X8_9BACT|nr:cytochrome c family protein [Solidesulfovibrio carbinoliphilus]EHJ47808.1 cytochrome c family protein [Solidesulfovibrio carbinoliphilus subsp. oakridgensis]
MARWRLCIAALLATGLCVCPAPSLLAQQTGDAAPPAAKPPAYVGSKACQGCHATEYESFSRYSKKAHSSQSVKIMAPKLSPEELRGCFACHTTGYGQPGGFVSFEQTPELANAGCEVCHGPGAAHVDSGGDPALIKTKLAMSECERCHSAERVRTFNFKPMLFAGAH